MNFFVEPDPPKPPSEAHPPDVSPAAAAKRPALEMIDLPAPGGGTVRFLGRTTPDGRGGRFALAIASMS